MKVIESEFEIDHISESISLSFKGFDFVIDTFYPTARDRVDVVIEEAMTVLHECVGDLFKLADI